MVYSRWIWTDITQETRQIDLEDGCLFQKPCSTYIANCVWTTYWTWVKIKHFSLMGLNEWYSGWYMICLKRSTGGAVWEEMSYSLTFFFVSGTNRIKSNSNQTFTDSELVSFSGFRLQWIDFFLLNSSCGWFETCYLINTITGSLLVAFFIYSSSLDNAI